MRSSFEQMSIIRRWWRPYFRLFFINQHYSVHGENEPSKHYVYQIFYQHPTGCAFALLSIFIMTLVDCWRFYLIPSFIHDEGQPIFGFGLGHGIGSMSWC